MNFGVLADVPLNSDSARETGETGVMQPAGIGQCPTATRALPYTAPVSLVSRSACGVSELLINHIVMIVHCTNISNFIISNDCTLLFNVMYDYYYNL